MSISKEHAVITYDQKQSQFILKDLQSVNGCTVNGVRHKAKVLVEGDCVVFGKDQKNQFRFSRRGRERERESYMELDRKI